MSHRDNWYAESAEDPSRNPRPTPDMAGARRDDREVKTSDSRWEWDCCALFEKPFVYRIRPFEDFTKNKTRMHRLPKERKKDMTQKTGYSGYYFENDENPRVLVATYNEEKARENPEDPTVGWFKPYGDRKFSPQPEDILRQEKVRANGDSGKAYYKVTLSSDFVEQNGIALIPPDPKYPRSESGWEPYNTENGFFEQLSGFSEKTAVSRLARRVIDLSAHWGPIQKVFELLRDANDEASLHKIDDLMDEARMHLQHLVVTGGYGLNCDLEVALPPFHPKPARARDEHHLTDRQVWHFRALYGLVMSIIKSSNA